MRAPCVTAPSYHVAGADYTLVSDDLVFDETVNKVCRNVSTEEDDVLEADKEFILTLDTGDSGVIVKPDQATITITDDDGVLICT